MKGTTIKLTDFNKAREITQGADENTGLILFW
jgi:hypothetical protein